MASSTNPTRIVTGKVRLSYVRVTSADENGKYSLCVLVDKKDKATLAKIKAAVTHLKTDPKAVGVWKGKYLASFKLPLRDGDTERDLDDQPEYAGMFFLNASTKTKPEIVDADNTELFDKDELYSGCYGRVSLNFYAFNTDGNKGIAVGLNNIQKKEDGERLDNHTSAEEDFGPAADDDDDDVFS